MRKIAVAIFCKTPLPGQSKTRLSPPLRPEECAALSACFIKDLASTVGRLASYGDVAPYALYWPRGTEKSLRQLLPEKFSLMLQRDDDFGPRLRDGLQDLLDAGHDGAILLNSDSPTLPLAILRAAVDAVRSGDNVVLSPALDGGYTLVGVSQSHPRLFEDIPWSTGSVHRLTLDRARDIDLPAVNVPGWYDIDDQASLKLLEQEFAGHSPKFASMAGADAPATRKFLRDRRQSVLSRNVA